MVSLGRKISLWKKDERLRTLTQARPILRSHAFDVRILPKQDNIARIIVISPKKTGSAPYRNLLKRRARSIFYQEKMFGSINDWVIYFRPSQSLLDYTKLHNTLLDLFKKHG
ncbi:MAG: ribonuclease P protein component [Candidatus Babeliaceae bacterium]|nr:ribonuclease P protein component [Candidatus Babeliaceae bacterium]